MHEKIVQILYDFYQDDPNKWIELSEIFSKLPSKQDNKNVYADIHYLEKKHIIESSGGKYKLVVLTGIDKGRLLVGEDINYDEENLRLRYVLR